MGGGPGVGNMPGRAQPRSASEADALARLERQRYQQELDRLKRMEAQGFTPDGKPISPKFQGLLNPKTGLLNQKYQLQAKPDVTVNQAGLNEIRTRALGNEDSPWAKLMMQRQDVQAQENLDNLNQQVATQNAQAFSDLAASGGISNATRERLAEQNSRNAMFQGQNLRRQAQMDKMGIGLQDQTQKFDLLKSLPGLEMGQADLAMKNRDFGARREELNLQNTLKDVDAKRIFDMNKYNEAMRAWAAEKSGQAMANSGSGKK